jgi:hypothetical protein
MHGAQTASANIDSTVTAAIQHEWITVSGQTSFRPC